MRIVPPRHEMTTWGSAPPPLLHLPTRTNELWRFLPILGVRTTLVFWRWLISLEFSFMHRARSLGYDGLLHSRWVANFHCYSLLFGGTQISVFREWFVFGVSKRNPIVFVCILFLLVIYPMYNIAWSISSSTCQEKKRRRYH